MQRFDESSAIFRILTDLVKSDQVITRTEVSRLEAHLKTFGVKDEDRLAGFGMTLGEAVEVLGRSSRALRSVVSEAMRDIAISDNECCREEAMLIATVESLGRAGNARIISRPVTDAPLLTSQLLYVEDQPGIASRSLDSSFSEISRIVEVAGLELIYIPEVVRNISRWMDGSDSSLANVFRLISPSSTAAETESLIRMVLSMDSRSFFHEVLRDRMGLDIGIDGPVWMLRLCNDSVNGVVYSNYLCVDVDQDNVKGQLRRIVDTINALQGPYSIMVNRHKIGLEDFQYGDFHRVLFDALSRRRQEGWRLNFYCQRYCPVRTGDGRRCQVSYQGEDGREIPVALSGREAAFFLLLLSSTRDGGLNLHDSRLQEKYASLYFEISPRESVPDITESSTLRPIKHRVIKALEESGIPEVYRFIPKTEGARLKVQAGMGNVRRIGAV